MQGQQRMAMGERLQQLLASGAIQDAGEIALVTGLLTAGQLAAGADPEAVAIAGLLGAGASIPARSAAAAMGRAAGRVVDNRMATPGDYWKRAYQAYAVGVPGTHENVRHYMNNDNLGTVQEGLHTTDTRTGTSEVTERVEA